MRRQSVELHLLCLLFWQAELKELPQLVVLLPLGLIKNCLCVPQTGPVCHPARFQRLDANSDSSGRGKDEDNIKYYNMITTDSKDSNDNSDMS